MNERILRFGGSYWLYLANGFKIRRLYWFDLATVFITRWLNWLELATGFVNLGFIFHPYILFIHIVFIL